MDTKIAFPKNSVEWQQYVSSMQQIRKGNITNQQMFNPKQGTMVQETRPVAPATSSNNWSNAIWKGYNTSDDLSTYIIPRHEQLQLALFSRHILKDPNNAQTQYLEKAQQRFRERPAFQSVKKYSNAKKSDFGGGTLMNPLTVSEDGTYMETNKMYAKMKE